MLNIEPIKDLIDQVEIISSSNGQKDAVMSRSKMLLRKFFREY